MTRCFRVCSSLTSESLSWASILSMKVFWLLVTVLTCLRKLSTLGTIVLCSIRKSSLSTLTTSTKASNSGRCNGAIASKGSEYSRCFSITFGECAVKLGVPPTFHAGNGRWWEGVSSDIMSKLIFRHKTHPLNIKFPSNPFMVYLSENSFTSMWSTSASKKTKREGCEVCAVLHAYCTNKVLYDD